jgi:hypothetical protein
MKYENKTILELKDICKKRDISGYSKLNKDELIRLIKKHLPKKKSISPKSKTIKSKIIKEKKMKGGEGEGTKLYIILTGKVKIERTGQNNVYNNVYNNYTDKYSITLDNEYTIDTIRDLTKAQLTEILRQKDYYNSDIYKTYIKNKDTTILSVALGNEVFYTSEDKEGIEKYITNSKSIKLTNLFNEIFTDSKFLNKRSTHNTHKALNREHVNGKVSVSNNSSSIEPFQGNTKKGIFGLGFMGL